MRVGRRSFIRRAVPRAVAALSSIRANVLKRRRSLAGRRLVSSLTPRPKTPLARYKTRPYQQETLPGSERRWNKEIGDLDLDDGSKGVETTEG